MYLKRVWAFWNPNQCQIEKEEAYVFAGCVMLCSLIINMTLHPYMLAVFHIGMKIRVACCSLIYRKVQCSIPDKKIVQLHPFFSIK